MGPRNGKATASRHTEALLLPHQASRQNRTAASRGRRVGTASQPLAPPTGGPRPRPSTPPAPPPAAMGAGAARTPQTAATDSSATRWPPARPQRPWVSLAGSGTVVTAPALGGLLARGTSAGPARLHALPVAALDVPAALRHADRVDDVGTGVAAFRARLARVMEVGGGQPGRMVPGVRWHPVRRSVSTISRKPEPRRKPWARPLQRDANPVDRRGEDAAGPYGTAGLARGGDTVLPFVEVAERAGQRGRVEGVVGDRESAGVAEPRDNGGAVPGEPGGGRTCHRLAAIPRSGLRRPPGRMVPPGRPPHG